MQRADFLQQLHDALEHWAVEAPPTLVLVDLDDFASCNHRFGIACGDAVLAAIASRIEDHFDGIGVTARLGDDEFGILVTSDVDMGFSRGHELPAVLAGPVLLNGASFRPTASVAICTSVPGDSVDVLLRNAATALSGAKQAGRGLVRVFDPARDCRIAEHDSLLLDLTDSVRNGELRLNYQPVYRLETRAIVGAEALVRWQHPVLGLLQPADFITGAEENGTIAELGNWVLREACAEASHWNSATGGEAIGVAVNVSRHQLRNADFVDEVRVALATTRLDPSLLTLEVTETALAQDGAAMIEVLNSIKDLGVEIAMDDFGTGYSSLSELRQMPIDVIKVDKSFVDGIASEPVEWALASSIFRVAAALGKRTVAEGIELSAQLAVLRSLACDQGQGFLLSHPLDAAGFRAMIGV